MFIGHYAVGLGGKPAAPRVSLGTWFMAVQLLDLLWPIFLLLGWEHVRIAPGATRLTPLDFYDYPITHSLVGALAWSALFGLAYAALRRWRTGGAGSLPGGVAALLGAGVFSHWLLDLLVHRPDLPLLPGGPYVGLGLWNAPLAAIALELGLYGAGAALYLRATRSRDRIGSLGLWLLLVVLPAGWLASIFGPPPPDVKTLAWSALGMWLFVPWAWWVDRHRAAVPRNR